MPQKILAIIILLSLSLDTHAQKARQDLQLLTYNVGLNGITAGVGAMINRHKNQTWYQSFIKGFCQGCFGGLCIYTGKSMAFEINSQKNYFYCWPSRIMYSVGTSIVENASLNNTFGENWDIDLWIFRCDVSLQKHPSCKVRLQLSSIYSICSMLYHVPDAKFDVRRTAMTGTVVFSTDTLIQDRYHGYTYENTVAISTNSPVYGEHHIAAHEIIHTYQNDEYQIFNTWLKPLADNVPDKVKGAFDTYLYLDVSYYQLFYSMQGTHSSQYYYKNMFELEAEHFACNHYVPLKRW